MIDEVPDRNTGREFPHAAKMIAVPVGRDQVIDLVETGVSDRSHDATDIPSGSGAPISRIHEQRLAGR